LFERKAAGQAAPPSEGDDRLKTAHTQLVMKKVDLRAYFD